MKYRIIAALLAALLVLSLTGCSTVYLPRPPRRRGTRPVSRQTPPLTRTHRRKMPPGMRTPMRTPGRRNLKRACWTTTTSRRITMRSWRAVSIRSMWRWTARSSPSSWSTPPPATITAETHSSYKKAAPVWRCFSSFCGVLIRLRASAFSARRGGAGAAPRLRPAGAFRRLPPSWV